MYPDQRARSRARRGPAARCSPASARPSKLITSAIALEAVGQPRAAAGPGCGQPAGVTMPAPALGRVEAVRQGVAQQHDVADRTGLDQRRPGDRGSRGTTRDRRSGWPRDCRRRTARPRAAARRRAVLEELGVHRAASLDHQPPHPAPVQVLAHRPQADRPPAVDDGGDRAQLRARHRRGVAAAVDELGAGPGGEEAGLDVELGPPGDRDLERLVRQARRATRADAAGSRTSSRGSSWRTVAAPTRIASLAARRASTRSKSSALDSSRRRSDASSR